MWGDRAGGRFDGRSLSKALISYQRGRLVLVQGSGIQVESSTWRTKHETGDGNQMELGLHWTERRRGSSRLLSAEA